MKWNVKKYAAVHKTPLHVICMETRECWRLNKGWFCSQFLVKPGLNSMWLNWIQLKGAEATESYIWEEPWERGCVSHNYATAASLLTRCRWLADSPNFFPALCLYLSLSFTPFFFFSPYIGTLYGSPRGDFVTSAMEVCFHIGPSWVIGWGGHCSFALTDLKCLSLWKWAEAQNITAAVPIWFVNVCTGQPHIFYKMLTAVLTVLWCLDVWVLDTQTSFCLKQKVFHLHWNT